MGKIDPHIFSNDFPRGKLARMLGLVSSPAGTLVWLKESKTDDRVMAQIDGVEDVIDEDVLRHLHTVNIKCMVRNAKELRAMGWTKKSWS